jgi:predicted dehydrogenase
MQKTAVRWGILGTAQIARKNWKAIRNAGNGVVVAVASRDLDRSRRFIAESQSQCSFTDPPKAFGSYEELLASPDVDAVYIPLPTGLRKEWVIRAAEARKHVVCEKPCGIDLADAREMVEACRRNQVQFMDGVMFMHSLRLPAIREVLDDGRSVGQVKRIASAFSFCASEDFLDGNIRMHSGLEPLGCLGDLGWYCIRFALWLMNWKMPLHVSGRLISQSGGSGSPIPVPTEFSGELIFENGISSSFYCSFLTDLQQWAIVSGARGYLHVPDFVLPFFGSELGFDVYDSTFQISGCDFKMEPNHRRVAVAEYSNSHPTSQETNLFRNFGEQVRSEHLNTLWPEMALKTQAIANACLDSARREGISIPMREIAAIPSLPRYNS